jgi:hypothetical protein
MLLNVAVFIWFGAVCPWYSFAYNSVIPIYRLIFLGILVLILRRLPIVFAMHKKIHQIEEVRQALFVGFFGPIGVSAVFYLYISLEFLRRIQVDGKIREDAAFLSEVMNVVIWFLVCCSIIVHGLSIPLGKLGVYLPRTISNAVSQQSDNPVPFQVRGGPIDDIEFGAEATLRRRTGNSATALPRRVYRIGRSVIGTSQSHTTSSRQTPKSSSPSLPQTLGREGEAGPASPAVALVDVNPLDRKREEASPVSVTVPSMGPRVIRFPDEEGECEEPVESVRKEL